MAPISSRLSRRQTYPSSSRVRSSPNNNYADGQAAQEAFTGFMNSPHHHEIMLDPRYNQAGVGEATNSKGFHYFTVIFVQN